MTDRPNHREAVELLQELGLKEYEARCLVALFRVRSATAKEISDLSEVPRTRVYDATRELQSRRLIQTRHASPKQFRAVTPEEAIETLESEYRSRTDALGEALGGIDPLDPEADSASTAGVWTLAGTDAVANRTRRLVDEASTEVVLAVGDGGVLTEALVTALRGAGERTAVRVLVPSAERTAPMRERLSGVETAIAAGNWLGPTATVDGEPTIRRVVCVDERVALVGATPADEGGERAVFARGTGNVLVVLLNRLMRADRPAEAVVRGRRQ